MSISTLPYDRPGVDAGPDEFTMPAPNFAFTGRNLPPRVSDASSNSSFEFISYSFACINSGYDHVSEMAPGMLCFSVRQKVEAEPNATVILAFPQVQKVIADQWDDFRTATTGDAATNSYYDPEAVEFLGAMQKFGETILHSYDATRNPNTQRVYTLNENKVRVPVDKYGEEVRLYWERACQDKFCYLTGFGQKKRISFIGVLIEPSRGTTINEITGQPEFAETSLLSVGIGRRLPVSQIFGAHDDVGIGCHLWLVSRRVYCGGGRYGSFEIRAVCCAENGFPTAAELQYRDEAGMLCLGNAWYVGYLLEPSDRPVSTVAIEAASNLGSIKNNAQALQAHGTLPTCWVAVGLKA